MADLFTRSPRNPILPSGTDGWWKIYNPGASQDDEGRIHIFPRMMRREGDDWHSRIGHAVSDPGTSDNFMLDAEPVLERTDDTAEVRGLEDPRITCIDGEYRMCFAAYSGDTRGVALHTARAKHLSGPWERLGNALPDFDFYRDGGVKIKWIEGKPVEKKSGSNWAKSGALFPERIGGKYFLLFGEYQMWLAVSDDGIRFNASSVPFLTARPGDGFDSAFVEAGPPPIRTEKGWLVLYHGIDATFRYQLGFLLLDLADPSKILFRSSEPIFGPREAYEIGDQLIDKLSSSGDEGIATFQHMSDEELKALYARTRNENVMPQVTFCPGAVLDGDVVRLYYGAGDTSVCTAYARLSDILALVP